MPFSSLEEIEYAAPVAIHNPTSPVIEPIRTPIWRPKRFQANVRIVRFLLGHCFFITEKTSALLHRCFYKAAGGT